MENKEDLIIIYRNYLYALEERKIYGDRYGDTDELIKIYEKKLEKVLTKKLLETNTKNKK